MKRWRVCSHCTYDHEIADEKQGFAWKAFSQWQERQEGTEEEKKKKDQMWDFLLNFRDTFSRPVRRIRFMGLFDTG